MDEMSTPKKPRVNSSGERELKNLQDKFDKFDQEVKDLTVDRLNATPKEETEMQTKISSRDAEKVKDVYLKPIRSLSSRERFNERFRKDYEHAKEYVHFIAENKEIIGENIDLWTKPYPGLPAEEWLVPVNKPVWGPRYLAEQIKSKTYHRLVMQENTAVSTEFVGTFTGSIVADTTIQRLDAHPYTKKKSLFVGANSF